MPDPTLTIAPPAQLATKPGWQTSEFWLKLLALLLGVLYTSGVLTNNTELAIAGIVSSMLGAVGYTVVRGWTKTTALAYSAPANDNTVAVESSVAVKQAGFASVGLMAFVAIGVLMIVSCAWLSSSAKLVEKGVIDCTTSSARDATKQFGPVVDALLAQATEENGKVNWAPVKDLTKNFGAELGGCVLSNVVAQALHPKPADPNAPKASQLVYDPVSLLAGFNALRAEQLGNKKFKTDAGEL